MKITWDEVLTSMFMGAITYIAYQAIKDYTNKPKISKNFPVSSDDNVQSSIMWFGDGYIYIKAQLNGIVEIKRISADGINYVKGQYRSMSIAVPNSFGITAMRDKALSLFRKNYAEENKLASFRVSFYVEL